jgi:hypothetical protein
MKTIEVSLEDRFRIWYLEPIETLKTCLKNGNGAIAALMIAMPLYERVYRFALSNNEPHTGNRPLWVMNDLRLKSETEAKLFWNVFRDGLCHTGSFFEQSDRSSSLPKIGLDGKYPDFPTFITTETGEDAIIVNPWNFIAYILNKYEDNVLLLEYESAPLLPLRYVIEDKET